MFIEPRVKANTMSDQPPVRTALYEEHLALDANMVDFHGFELLSGIPTSRKSTSLHVREQVCSTFLTWVRSALPAMT